MKNNNLKIEYRKIDELIPYINNARKNEGAVDKVASSIKNFGMVNPILIDKDNEIIAGHTRLLALKKLGYVETPTIRLDDLTEPEVKALRLADNKTAEFSEWDDELLSVELDYLQSIEDLDFSMFEFGFDDIVISEENDVVEDEAEIEIPEEPKSKLGDVYKLGRHRLMCGDSTKRSDLVKLTKGQLVDMYLTDPPYNVNYEGKTKDALTIQNDAMADDDFRGFLVEAFKVANEVMKAGAVFYIWHADSEGYNFRGACHDVGWKVRQCLIWNKSSMVMGRQDYHWKHEPCLYGWKDGAGHLWASDRKQTTILNFDKPHRSTEHPTMKPVTLFDYQIKNNTKGGDLVLDSFGGSGTTLMACEQNGRNALIMELDPRYVDVIINRWEEFTGQKAELIEEEQNV